MSYRPLAKSDNLFISKHKGRENVNLSIIGLVISGQLYSPDRRIPALNLNACIKKCKKIDFTIRTTKELILMNSTLKKQIQNPNGACVFTVRDE